MKTVKILFSVICILFMQGILVELSAQGSLDSIRKEFLKNGNIKKTAVIRSDSYSYTTFIIENDEQLVNEFMKAFKKEAVKASHFSRNRNEGISSESYGFEDRENNLLYTYSYELKDSSGIEIIYAKSEMFPQKGIAEQDNKNQESDEQLFSDFMETLKADIDCKRRQLADTLKMLKRQAEMQKRQAERQVEMQKRQAEMQKKQAERQVEMQKRQAEMQKKQAERQVEMQKRQADMQKKLAERQVEMQKRQAEMQKKQAERQAEMLERQAEMQKRQAERQAEMLERQAEMLKRQAERQTEMLKRQAEAEIRRAEAEVGEAREMGLDVEEL